MATHTNLSSLFTDIADSIRSVSGGTASIQADTFPTAIQSLGSGFAKIQTGSYVGTGTYGASNPCSLTFDFTPYFVVMRFQYVNYLNMWQTSLRFYSSNYCYQLLFSSLSTEFTQRMGFYQGRNGHENSFGKRQNNSLIWYNAFTGTSQGDGPYCQLNSHEYIYFYMGQG